MPTYQNSSNYSDAVRNASRKVWLASLGAAVVTREWAQAEAPKVIRSLVKEGTLVESRTIRVVGDRLEGTFTRANMIWRRAQSTVRQAAGNAITLVQSNLPTVKLPAMFAPAAKPAAAKKRAAKATRATKPRAKKATKQAPRRKARTAK